MHFARDQPAHEARNVINQPVPTRNWVLDRVG
jgi:hypothetical protein